MDNNRIIRNIFSALAFIVIFLSCTRNYTPRPKGFLRIEPPVAQYVVFDEVQLPYSFSFSRQAIIELPQSDSNISLLNIYYPDFDAKIYCSYIAITPRELNNYTEDCRKLAGRVARNANAITEKYYENKDNNVYATLFIIDGDAASPAQFMLTDSVKHFFRGALYYKYKTDSDSIAPVTNYIENDMTELIQSFHWKK
jgi:hypothetical protein